MKLATPSWLDPFLYSLALLLVLLLANDLSNSFLKINNKNPAYLAGRANVDAAAQHSDAEIVVLGDSSSGMGINDKRLGQWTGYRVLHLTAPARMAQMNALYAMQRFYAAGGRPRLVIDVRSPSFMGERWHAQLFFENYFNARDLLALNRHGIIGWKETLSDHLPNLFPLYRNRFALRRVLGEVHPLLSLHNPWEGKQRYFPGKKSEVVGNRNRHYLTSYDQAMAERRQQAAKGFRILPIDSYYLDRLLELTRQHHTPYWFAYGPLSQDLLDDPQTAPFYHSAAQQIEALSARLGFTLMDKRQLLFPKEFFYDSPEHLTKNAALIYTRFVADHVIDHRALLDGAGIKTENR